MRLIKTGIWLRGRMVYIQATGSEHCNLGNRQFLRKAAEDHLDLYSSEDASDPLEYLEVPEVEPEPKLETAPEPEVASDGSRGRTIADKFVLDFEQRGKESAKRKYESAVKDFLEKMVAIVQEIVAAVEELDTRTSTSHEE